MIKKLLMNKWFLVFITLFILVIIAFIFKNIFAVIVGGTITTGIAAMKRIKEIQKAESEIKSNIKDLENELDKPVNYNNLSDDVNREFKRSKSRNKKGSRSR